MRKWIGIASLALSVAFANAGAFTDAIDGSIQTDLIEEISLSIFEREMAQREFTQWEPSTAYVLNDVRWANGAVWNCNNAHTSGGTFTTDNWDVYDKYGSGGGEHSQNITDAYEVHQWIGWIQDFLETECVRFVDPTADVFANPTVSNYFTVASWRAYSGIHSNGFRRMRTYYGWTNWRDVASIMYTTNFPWDGGYGRVETNDIYGPWIIDDIQKGLASMKRTVSADTDHGWIYYDDINRHDNHTPYESWYAQASEDDYPSATYSTLYTNAYTNWHGTNWVEGGGSHLYGVYALRRAGATDIISTYRERAKTIYADAQVPTNTTVDAVCKVFFYGGDADDPDGLGLATNVPLTTYSNTFDYTSLSVTGSYLGLTNFPPEQLGWQSEPAWWATNGTEISDTEDDGMIWVLDWNFTYDSQ